jgi:hypothetical protein
MLRPEYRRRSVVLDTGYMRGRGSAIADMLTGYYRDSLPGAVQLAAACPPARLSDSGLGVLRCARDALTDAGREEFPGIEALELAALGRLALAGGDGHEAAAYATGLDYLLVTETVPGMVAEGWQLDLGAVRRWLGEDAAAPLTAAVAAARAGRRQASEHARARVAGRERQSDELTRARDTLAEALRLAVAQIEPRRIGSLTSTRKASAAGVRGVLGKLRGEVRACRSPGRLDELAARAAGPLADAQAIAAEARAELGRRDSARQEAARQRQADTRTARHARQIEAARNKSVTAARSQALSEVTARARQLEQLYRRTSTKHGESPLAVLRDLDVLYHAEPPPAPSPPGAMRRALRALTPPDPGRLHVRGHPELSFPGSALRQWGPQTRAAIAPVLAGLHASEDQLRAQLGRKPRQNRPALNR